MNPITTRMPAGLYLVATPIGTARDITLRALDLLTSGDVLVAEDTRSLRRLLEIHGIALGDRPLWSYHDHSGEKTRTRILDVLEAGKSVVYASEAGTPMIADPGFDLVRSVQGAGHSVTSAPGPSAVITALTLAGLPTDKFLFAGFLPNARSQRKTALRALSDVEATLVFYESPKRVATMLCDASETLGGGRDAAVCRELTKKFEEVMRGTLDELAERCAARTLKGEVVVLVGKGHSEKIRESDLEDLVKEALAQMSVRDAADAVAGQTGAKRRQVYQLALKLAAGT
ncbi:16S rRNA (cytidine(1402)-2'-O)-methyltransferase [Roseovarius sp. E0-M6]|uniref:16S rRNA (cytidine(1402)-2'-O)-methyltransferase n=1 Tax=Roseovarius sp. E0-M6 TaxID=3127118 RepID=UPI00300F9854